MVYLISYYTHASLGNNLCFGKGYNIAYVETCYVKQCTRGCVNGRDYKGGECVDIREIIARYQDKPGGLIEAYHAVQKEFNYLPRETVQEAARVFGVSEAQAYGVATFYSYLSVGKRGKYIIRMCESAPCHVAGADELLKALEKTLGIAVGQTTPDGKFTLELTECIGQCQATPVITINSVPYPNMSPDKISAILAQCT